MKDLRYWLTAARDGYSDGSNNADAIDAALASLDEAPHEAAELLEGFSSMFDDERDREAIAQVVADVRATDRACGGVTLSFYRKLLSDHDWLYMFSDDHTAWKAGEASRQRIESLALLSRDHAEAYFSARNAAHSMKPEGQGGIRSN